MDKRLEKEIDIMNNLMIEVGCRLHIIQEILEWIKLHELEEEYIISNDFQLVKNKRKNADMWICNELEELFEKYEKEYKSIRDNVIKADNAELLTELRIKRDIMSDIVDDIRKILY